MRTYTLVVEPEDTGSFMVSVPALPGCFTQGATLDECRERAVEAIEVYIAGLRPPTSWCRRNAPRRSC
jgi:antitoxin HicB